MNEEQIKTLKDLIYLIHTSPGEKNERARLLLIAYIDGMLSGLPNNKTK